MITLGNQSSNINGSSTKVINHELLSTEHASQGHRQQCVSYHMFLSSATSGASLGTDETYSNRFNNAHRPHEFLIGIAFKVCPIVVFGAPGRLLYHQCWRSTKRVHNFLHYSCVPCGDFVIWWYVPPLQQTSASR